MSISIGEKMVKDISIDNKDVLTIKNTSNVEIFRKRINEYAEQYSYIESTGTQYIDTGFQANQNTSVGAKFNASSSTGFIFGARIGAGNGQFCYHPKTSDNSTHLRYGSASIGFGRITTDVTLSTNKTVWTVNGTKYTFSTQTFSCPYDFILFGFNNAGSIEKQTLTVYYFKIYDNGTLVRDFIPCTLTADIPASKDSQNTARTSGTVGMWDTVTDKFYANAGTGTFVAG